MLHTGIKKGIGKLLALSQGTLNNLEIVNVGEVVLDGLVGRRLSLDSGGSLHRLDGRAVHLCSVTAHGWYFGSRNQWRIELVRRFDEAVELIRRRNGQEREESGLEKKKDFGNSVYVGPD